MLLPGFCLSPPCFVFPSIIMKAEPLSKKEIHQELHGWFCHYI